MNEIFIIIAAYNEEKNISEVLKELKKNHENIIVVDDGSKDKTYETAKKEGVKTLKHVVNLGKGAAMKTGCDYAIQQNAKILVLVDADGQHKPKDVPKFIKALEKADIVFGHRSLDKNMPSILRFGNNFINNATKILFNIKIKDTQCGFRAMTKETYKKVRWTSTDYAMESEMIANAGKERLKYVEIPIETIYADKYKGTTVFDGVKIVLNMIKWKLRW